MYTAVVPFRVQPGKIEEAVRIYRESVIPVLQEQKGFKGAFLLTDAATNKGYSLGLWETEADARDRLMRLAQAHPEWALGFQDEVGWSRVAPPRLRTWAAADTPLRLQELALAKDDRDPKALACSGVLVRRPGCPTTPEHMLLRFVAGRPVSAVTIDFLKWSCQALARQRVKVLALIWDNASWHISRTVRTWIREHNRQVKRKGPGVRILVCYLPSKSPWLNPIEPKWLHGKRAIVEPTRLLSADEWADRVCARFDCAHEPHLVAPKKAA